MLDKIKLEGVFWDEEDPMAIINGQVVRQGTRIGNARVVRINRDSSLVLEIDGTQYTLR